MDGRVESSQKKKNLKGRVFMFPQTDETLTKAGYAADAKMVGEEIADLKKMAGELSPNIAGNVIYDNTNSNAEVLDVQSALDLLFAKCEELSAKSSETE